MGERNLRFLLVKAHTHDFTHCAGTMGIHTSLGDEVTLVAVTTGAQSHNRLLAAEMAKPPDERDPAIVGQTLEEIAAVKMDELRRAAALFGITDVRSLHAPEPFRVDNSPEVIEKLADIILEVRPHVLINQSPFLSETHRMATWNRSDEHAETAYAAQEAQGLAGSYRPGSTQPPHSIAATYYPGVYFNQDDWDFVVDIGDWYKQRIQAEAMFVAQGHTPAWARREIEVMVGGTGRRSGAAYAEAFVRQRPELLDRIIVPESALAAASGTSVDSMRRMSGETGEAEQPA